MTWSDPPSGPPAWGAPPPPPAGGTPSAPPPSTPPPSNPPPTWGAPSGWGAPTGGNPSVGPPPFRPVASRRGRGPLIAGLLLLLVVGLVGGYLLWNRNDTAGTAGDEPSATDGVTVTAGAGDPAATTTAAPVGSPGIGVADSALLCDEQLRAVKSAVETYAALNGSYPTSLDDLLGPDGVLKDRPTDLTYTATGDAASGYVVTGTGRCVGHDLRG